MKFGMMRWKVLPLHKACLRKRYSKSRYPNLRFKCEGAQPGAATDTVKPFPVGDSLEKQLLAFAPDPCFAST